MAEITIKDIAKICGVGISTVSRAIYDEPGINENTRNIILKVIEEYHYIPNNSARHLKMTESNTVALLVKGIDNQFFQGMLKIFEEELFSTDEIFEKVWNEKVYEANNTVMVHIRRLRGKMKEDTRANKIITTVWGVGYKIEK